MTPRATILVTGSELVRGSRADQNGPFLAAELTGAGLDPARIVVVGDGLHELASAIAQGLADDLLVCSGGLGPTHDDRTVELLAGALGRGLTVVPELEREIEAISRSYAERMGRPYHDFHAGVVKQATLPDGAISLGLAGTAPGVLVEHERGVAIALPGPPPELRRLWAAAREHQAVQAILARVPRREHRVQRFFGPSESAVARVLGDAGGEANGVDVTICARDLEIHVDLFVREEGRGRAAELERMLDAEFSAQRFATDERSVEELVLVACRARAWRLATAESCTGGMVGERLTSVPGSSDVFVGGVVSYANEVKHHQLGVPADLLSEHGAVSSEVAEAMAEGVRVALAADVGVAITGVAGPGGGTTEKPVGLVHVHVVTPEASRGVRLELPGDRDGIRRRAAVTALHLVRRLATPT